MSKQLDTEDKNKPPRRSPRFATNVNESNCPLCDHDDNVEMVECSQCKKRYHFQCVGVNSTISQIDWICHGCKDETKSKANLSVKSSTSSKRHSRLQLEMLAREKAIQDKLIEDKAKLAEQQAAVNQEFLQKEYEIRDAMTDSEDELKTVASKGAYVDDWLERTAAGDLNQTRPFANVDDFPIIPESDVTTDRDTLQNIDQQTPDPQSTDLKLIPPKQVQFADPMIGNIPPIDQCQVLPNPDGSTGTNNLPYVQQYQSGIPPPPFVLDIMNQQRQKAISNRFSGLSIQPPAIQPPAIQPPTIQPPAIQPPMPFASTTTHTQNASNQGQSTAPNTTVTTPQGNTVPNTTQPQLVNPNIQPPAQNAQSSVSTSTPNQNQSTQNTNQPFNNTIPSQYLPLINPQQYAPTSGYQPVLGLNAIPIGFGQPMSGQNTLSPGGLGTQTMSGLNNMTSQTSPVNNPQLGPSRLQLAARRTMPREYPKFNGDPAKWLIFYNAYINCTNTCGLTNGENLSRLEKCLEDPARKAVQNLLTRPDAVPDIIETLKMLYGRPEASIEAQLRTIKDGSPPKMHQMETFIDFAMSIRNITSEIQASGMWQYLWNPPLMQELADKLPYQMRLEWGQMKIAAPNVSLIDFSNWLFLRAKTACAVTIPVSVDRKSNKSNSNNHVNSHSKDNNVDKKAKDNIPKRLTNSNETCCHICNNKSHPTEECRKFIAMPLNDRWESVKNNKLCRICLGDHHILRCDSKLLCGEPGCTIKHHKLLHNPNSSRVVATTNASGSNNVHSAHLQNKIVILRRYIPVTLHGPNGSFNVIAFLDDGSDMTLVENWVTQKLGISGKPEDLYLKWTAKIVRKETNSQSITFKISGTEHLSTKYQITDARTVKSLNLPTQTIDAEQMKIDYKFLRRLPIESFTEQTPSILIGLRDCRFSTPRKIRSGRWNEPIATKTLLGWEIHGANAPSAEASNLNLHIANETTGDEGLHQMVERFFSIENFGVKTPENTVEALSDKRARHLLESTTRRIGNKFETGLLWKYDDISLLDSYPMAKRRLESLERRLQKDPELATKFLTKFHEYLEKDYVRKLDEDEIADTTERTWYLPLFPVTYPKKPGKIRLVWDAAAKVSNISLNSMLLSGPDLLVSLQGVLYRFREKPFTVLGDIREMFHQVSIVQQDQTSQRFLWREKGSPKIDVYVLQVMSFGATCSPSSAQHVKNRNAREFKEQYPKAEEAIRTNTYVDDWLQSFDTEIEAEEIAKQVKFVHSQGGFEIRNWLSNSTRVSRSLGVNSEDEQQLSLELDECQTERILGMWWHVKQDKFTYSLRYTPINKEILTGARRPTKREALRTLMSIYDPLGFLAAYLVQLKMILQDIWRTKIGWDDQIPEKDDDRLFERWMIWISYLPDIERVNINRHYSARLIQPNPTKIELHIFVDAGDLAYATVAYFRIEDRDGIECTLIGGKTKVAPLRPLSVPRMELQAAVLGARFRNTILELHTLEVERTVFWCDSATVLSWLRSDLRKYTQYVGARVCEIQETTSLAEWRWIPSNMNVADDATKLKSSFSLDMDSRWFRGPEFLLRAERYWPTTGEISETDEEKKPKYVNAHIIREIEKLPIKFERFSQWKRTMALVARFINNVKAKLNKPGFVAQYGHLTRKEILAGENALYRRAQLDEFDTEINELQQKRVDSKGRLLSVEKASPIYRYAPYLDNAMVLRMRGRIDALSNVSLDQKRPIILPTKHHITDLVVTEYHQQYKHQNTETVINEIKQKFIIPRLRALLKRIRRSCQHCKNAAAQPQPPEMSQLPFERLASFTRPYTFVGIDYAGPYKITQFRRSVKRWIVLFTCLTIRAVYIDVVESLTSDSCIMSIRRFIARNGTPSTFFSDRGVSFVGADNELAKEITKIDHDLLNVTFTTCYTQWHFNPPYGQHMGGAWERLIGSMKRTLDKILPTSHYPNQETFVTALAEVENIINSRPLTFVSIEPHDQEALTPNHFLKGSSNGNKPPCIFPPSPKTLRGNWRYAQQIANEFWNKWVKEYLPMITRRTKWFENVKPIELGDWEFIIVDENAPRNTWERGVVIETLKSGSDGLIRRVNVRTTNGIYNRPVSKLAVLDLEGPEAKTLTRESLAGGSVTASNNI